MLIDYMRRKIEGCQRESLTQSIWTMSFADQRDKVYCKPVLGTRWKFVISLESQLVEELLTVPRRYFFCGSFMFLFCLVFAMFCARLFICASWSPAGKGLTSWLSFVVSSVSLSLSHWYPGSGVVLDCIDSWSLQPYLLALWKRSVSLSIELAA